MRFLGCHQILALSLAALVRVAQSGQVPLQAQQEQVEGAAALAEDFGFDPDALRLVEFFASGGEAAARGPTVWMTEAEKLAVKAQGTDFMDITETPFLGYTKKPTYSYPPPNSTLVAPVFPYLSTAELKANLEHFTSYHNRWYNSDTGKASSEWLYGKISAYADDLASEELRALIEVEAVRHPFKQNSIIVHITPPDALDSDPVTILGAHIDSQNYGNFTARAPGAGDDGSGTVTILEAYRGLLIANYIPTSPLEFHFYAGEEGGLRGSQAIASRYENDGKAVKGMMQFDMTAWHAAGTREEIAVITNWVDPALTEFEIQLIERYLEIPWVTDAYPGNAGSDHMSWMRAGYQACHPLEGAFNNTNDHIHGVDDRIDISPEFSFDHMLHFSKLAVAFAIEMTSY